MAIEAQAVGSARGGDSTFMRSLVTGLSQMADEEDAFPLVVRRGARLPSAVASDPRFPLWRLPSRPSSVRFLAGLPLAVARSRPPVDLLYSQVHLPLWCPVPMAVHVADLSFVHLPDLFPITTRHRLARLVPFHIRQARVVTTDSEYSRQDIVRTYEVTPEKVFVLSNAVDTSTVVGTGEEAVRNCLAAHGLRPPLLLYVGNLHPRKNVPRMVRAFQAARRARPALAAHTLVVAGGRWWGEERRTDADPHVRFLGRVSDLDRECLVRAAEALVYVSLFEGFGLPPLEAMAMGTPVIASNVTSLPEVLGDGALLVDPLDEEAIARAIVDVVTRPDLRSTLVRRGRARASLYSEGRLGSQALNAFAWALGRERPVAAAVG